MRRRSHLSVFFTNDFRLDRPKYPIHPRTNSLSFLRNVSRLCPRLREVSSLSLFLHFSKDFW